MQLPQHTIEFGWRNDEGVGEMLVDQIVAGEKWATCGFRRDYTEAELEETLSGTNRLYAVKTASDPRPRAIIRVTSVFETPFGRPDARLVAGEGDGDDVAKFQRDHVIAWQSSFPGTEPGDDEPLVVELFELVAVVDPDGKPVPVSR